MKTIYKAEDGTEFSEMQDCMDHEKKCERERLLLSPKLFTGFCVTINRKDENPPVSVDISEELMDEQMCLQWVYGNENSRGSISGIKLYERNTIEFGSVKFHLIRIK